MKTLKEHGNTVNMNLERRVKHLNMTYKFLQKDKRYPQVTFKIYFFVKFTRESTYPFLPFGPMTVNPYLHR